MSTDNDERARRIRELNDAFRTTLQGGRVATTKGVHSLGPERLVALLGRLRTFNEFDEANDPHGEHDFGGFDQAGDEFLWKIDYYDTTLTFHSEDASDPTKTLRVLTLMLAEEY
jgi:hypothetical protein